MLVDNISKSKSRIPFLSQAYEQQQKQKISTRVQLDCEQLVFAISIILDILKFIFIFFN
jgi:hypothetical protein